GRGGMGVVFKARHRRLNRLVALKMIRAGAGAVTAERARFRAEAEAIARLRHPHIVQIHDIGDAGGQPYLALEFVDGGSLARKLADAPQTPREAAGLMLLLARAVHDTHKAGVVHRDLKPGNVLLTADGTPKIGDFGLARLLDQESSLTQSGAVLGTPAYMAPEQASGLIEHVGPPADVYALGAVLYEILTGRPPFRGASPLDTLDQVRNRDPVPPGQLQPGVPRDLETICLKCLQKDPDRRYADAGALADACAAFLQGTPIKARPAGPVERAVKWARRRPWVAGLSGLVVLLVLGGFVAGYVYNSRLRTALATADRQRSRAEANYLKTQEAVDALLLEVGDKDLADVPEMEEVRARLVE
ncbi:MAG: serine/threonine protein kinase, partial [Thermoleophilia bacterium]|nr:serine/threonine protein kinase [Thermoleophilia bacterium]